MAFSEDTNRALKAGRIVDTLTALDACPTATVLRDLDDAGWTALETLAGVKPASPRTRQLVVERLELRERLVESDPFDCFS